MWKLNSIWPFMAVLQSAKCNQMLQSCIWLLSESTQGFYYFPIKAVGKLRGRKTRRCKRKKPQVTSETGAPSIHVVSEEGVNTTPPLCTEGAFWLPVRWTLLVISDLQQVIITTMCYCAGINGCNVNSVCRTCSVNASLCSDSNSWATGCKWRWLASFHK